MHQQQNYDYNKITIDESPKLSVIKQSGLSDQVQETLSSLLDNNLILNKNGKQIPMIRIFLKSSEINEKQETQYNINNSNQIKIIENIIKMQLNQLMTNSLIFQNNETNCQNILVTILLSQLNQFKNQKFLFINASGLEINIDFDLKSVKNKFQLYEFRKFDISQNNKNQQQYQKKKIILLNKSPIIFWENIKHQLKLELQSQFNMFQPNIVVFQLYANFQDDSCLKFDLNCIEKMVKYFRKKSKEKLIINLIINQDDYQGEYQQEINLNKQNFENMNVNIKLKQFINAIQQGILNENKGKKVFKQSDKQEVLNIQKNQILSRHIYEYIRVGIGQLLNELSFQKNIATASEVQTSFDSIQILDYNGNYKLINLLFEQSYLLINEKSQLIVDYKDNILIVYQQDSLKLYYAININEDKTIFELQIIDLSDFIDEQILKETKRYIPPNIGIKNQKIYIFYGFLGDQLIEINTKSNTVIKKFKTELSDKKQIQKTLKSQENLIERDGAIVSSLNMNNQSTFLLIGGELGETSRISNQIECIFVEQNNFESGFLSKQIVNQPQSFRPFRNQIILEDNDFIIALPGDYDNLNYKYSQVINTSFYKKGQKLSLFQKRLLWQDIDFKYSNEKLGRKYPIHKLPGIQRNIIRISQNCWIASFMNFERTEDRNQLLFKPKFFNIKFTLQNLSLTIDIEIIDQEKQDAEQNQ